MVSTPSPYAFQNTGMWHEAVWAADIHSLHLAVQRGHQVQRALISDLVLHVWQGGAPYLLLLSMKQAGTRHMILFSVCEKRLCYKIGLQRPGGYR
jgi:hypothetical protein